ncbi:MAG: isoprenylcysteine carboxylmethyltransferase family protein [Candidatus Competibacteraceae bacterium]|nr:isoprenylcysteine carboxylmethyltransferase family protein [Candidatus Competibacteraceae bacterium]
MLFWRHPLLSHLLVLCQFCGLVLACWPVGLLNRGSPWMLLLCAGGTVLGLYTLWHNPVGNFSVYPEIKPQARLITSGPYRYIRHPMYSALMLMLLGIALYNGHWLNALGLGLVVVAVFNKARIEERLLPALFPDYAAYSARTKRFVPGLY